MRELICAILGDITISATVMSLVDRLAVADTGRTNTSLSSEGLRLK